MDTFASGPAAAGATVRVTSYPYEYKKKKTSGQNFVTYETPKEILLSLTRSSFFDHGTQLDHTKPDFFSVILQADVPTRAFAERE